MKYFNNRYPLDNIREEDLENAYKALIDALTEEWLEKDKYHPLRALWKRKDQLASSELFCLGQAIAEISKVDAKWVRGQVKHLKREEKNNYQGAIAELLSIRLLNHKDVITVPAKSNQPGFDALMTLVPSGKQIRLSIKNYGQSSHEAFFVKWAKKTEKIVEDLLKKYQYDPVTVWIDSPFRYPTEEHWKSLHSHIDNLFKLKRNDPDYFSGIVTNIFEWSVIISPHIAAKGLFHSKFNSYTLVCSAAYHPNESDNLLSKLSDACTNLSKHAAIEDDGIRNFLFIHLSPLASIKKCKEWLTTYFKEHPEKPVSSVIFHQPSILTDPITGHFTINHFFYFYFREERLMEWSPEGFQFSIEIPIGILSMHETLYALNFYQPDGTVQQITVDNRYMFQTGKHFIQAHPDSEGIKDDTPPIGSGIVTNLVLETPDKLTMEFQERNFPPSDQLLIL